MKVFTTPQFNEAVKNMSSIDQKIVYRAYTKATSLTKEQLFSAGKLMPVMIEGEQIYTLKDGHIRIYCIFENQNSEEGLVFIDVERKTDNRIKFKFIRKLFNDS